MSKIIKVLYADDEIYDKKTSKESYIIDELEKNGDIKIFAAINGTIALNHLLNKNTTDIIIVDVMMPPGKKINIKKALNGQETGYELIRVIRKKLKLKIPIIILTIYPHKMSLKEIKDLKISEYIDKPILSKDLLGKIKRYTKK
jgi:CheY-like chemotaxis protein